jgi:hypothetical protein
MQSESRSSKQLKLKKCLEDLEVKNNLLYFFETLVEIARENPELIPENPHLNKEKSRINTKKHYA